MARILSTQTGQPGGALSLDGGFIQAKSSSPDVLTIQGASAQAGDLLNLSTYKANATDASGEVVSITASGAGTWGEPQSFFGGTKTGVVTAAPVGTNPPGYTVLSSNSGKMHIVTAFASAGSIALPTHSSGLQYKFFIQAVSTGKLAFVSTPGTIVYGSGAVGASVAAGTAADWVGGTVLEFVSDGTNWYMAYSPPQAEAAELIAVANS